MVLQYLRAGRGFDARELLESKIGRIHRWFDEQHLDAAVVGVSGGVDSAVVLALLVHASRRPGSPLRRVVALLLPIESRGATRQAEATARGRLVAKRLGAETWEAPLSGALDATVRALGEASGLAFDAWAEGQCLSVVRTPALYGAAALLQAHGFRSVVVGTTNRDEGAYLGFFGKASDGMVDVQPISDLHKSEVRALAGVLGIDAEVIGAVPSGDVHDGRTDEEMIGASYDEVEAVIRLRELGRSPLVGVGSGAGVSAAGLAAVERQHATNRHKYAVGTPAVHLDVMPRGVPGGACDSPLAGRDERPPPAGALPGAWEPPPLELEALGALPPWEEVLAADPHALARRVHGVLSGADCARLIEAMERSGCAEPVGVTGVKESYGVGSMRATAWSAGLASALWQRLRPAVPTVRFLDAMSPTEGFATETRAGHRSWRVVGLSPVLRFMRYDPGGRHLCHYDAGYDYGDGRRTLLSVVFYLTDAPAGGATRFVRDGQGARETRTRDFSDWSRDTRDDEVVARVVPSRGDVLVFDHRLCHDVESWAGPGPRIIVRADVVYEAIPDGRSL